MLLQQCSLDRFLLNTYFLLKFYYKNVSPFVQPYVTEGIWKDNPPPKSNAYDFQYITHSISLLKLFTFIFSALLPPGNFTNPNIARAILLQHRAFTKIAHILNRMCIWCNDTTTKQVINYKYELIILWACYLNTNDGSCLGICRISTTEIQLLPCTQTIGCNCQCGIVAHVKVKLWQRFEATEEILEEHVVFPFPFGKKETPSEENKFVM